MANPRTAGRRAVRLGVAGAVLIALAWPATWLAPGERSHLLFFPLWLGYILVVEAVTLWRQGSSPLTAQPRRYACLFAVSVPVWWLFEGLNLRLGNWVYVGRESIGPVEYFLTASLAFSTVVPAVFSTARLLRSVRWIERCRRGPRLDPGRRGLAAWFAAGAGMLALLLVWPRYFFPLVWLALVFLLEPVARRLGRRCLLDDLRHGDWRTAVSLALGALVCGFFWELWNFYACPKWIYRIPFVDFARVFEMPILGYGGYLPFGLELYPLVHLLLPPSLTPALWRAEGRD